MGKLAVNLFQGFIQRLGVTVVTAGFNLVLYVRSGEQEVLFLPFCFFIISGFWCPDHRMFLLPVFDLRFHLLAFPSTCHKSGTSFYSDDNLSARSAGKSESLDVSLSAG